MTLKTTAVVHTWTDQGHQIQGIHKFTIRAWKMKENEKVQF